MSSDSDREGIDVILQQIGLQQYAAAFEANKLRNTDNPQEIDCFLSNYFDQLLDCGITNAYQMAREQKDTLVQIIIKHHIFTEGEIDVSLSEVMSFVTGADSIPPCGFTKDIDIDFYSDDGRLPSVSTCALQLWLPRVSDPDIILNMMIRAIKESLGFLKV